MSDTAKEPRVSPEEITRRIKDDLEKAGLDVSEKAGWVSRPGMFDD